MKVFFMILILSLSTNSCEESADNQITKTLYVAHYLTDCTGVGPQKCMLIKENIEDDFSYFYDNIAGFDFEEGFNYTLKVTVESIKNPPADGSSLKYSLVEIIKKEKVTLQKQIAKQWTVINLEGIENLSQKPTFLFSENENKISGSTGCNNYFGTYKIENNSIRFSEMGTTRKMCPDMTTENSFLSNLGLVNYFKIEKENLFLFDEKDTVLMVCKIAY